MRQLLLSLAGAVLVGLGALSAQPAQAQGFSVTIGTGYYDPPVPVYQPYSLYRRPVVQPRPVRVFHPPVPVYREPVRAYRPYHPDVAYHRPVKGYHPYPAHRPYVEPVYDAPSCTTQVTRFWDGFAWVSRREQICD